MKTNNIMCAYCGTDIEGKRQHFCSDICNAKYWSGVYRKKWKRGDSPVMKGNIPTQKELTLSKQKYMAHKLAYKNYKRGGVNQCDICKIKTKNIHRHHENYKSDICMLLCIKCHGLVKRYNNLKKLLSTNVRGYL